MNSYVQLICLILSFGYGILLYYFNQFNYRIFINKNIVLKIIGSLLYVNNATLLYIYLLYRINSGILHIYFILFIVLGYIFSSVKKRKL